MRNQTTSILCGDSIRADWERDCEIRKYIASRNNYFFQVVVGVASAGDDELLFAWIIELCCWKMMPENFLSAYKVLKKS
jgi:hypothetical protein